MWLRKSHLPIKKKQKNMQTPTTLFWLNFNGVNVDDDQQQTLKAGNTDTDSAAHGSSLGSLQDEVTMQSVGKSSLVSLEQIEASQRSQKSTDDIDHNITPGPGDNLDPPNSTQSVL
jgi:hypothetical protein